MMLMPILRETMLMLMQVTSLSKWDSLVGEEGLLKPSERPVVLNRSTFQLCPILSTIVYFCPLWSIYTHCFYFCLIVTIFVCTSQVINDLLQNLTKPKSSLR